MLASPESKNLADYLDRLPSPLRNPGSFLQGEIELLAPELGEAGYGVLYEDKYVLLLRDKVKFPDGSVGGYLRLLNQSDLTGSSGTVIVPVIGESILFIRTFRHAIRDWSWELPRGFQEAGLSEEENASKELCEELGGDVVKISRIGEINANTGLTAGKIGVYQAILREGCVPKTAVDRVESIKGWEMVEPHRVAAFILERKVVCGISLAALMLHMQKTNEQH